MIVQSNYNVSYTYRVCPHVLFIIPLAYYMTVMVSAVYVHVGVFTFDTEYKQDLRLW